jgi:hypothetical protein
VTDAASSQSTLVAGYPTKSLDGFLVKELERLGRKTHRGRTIVYRQMVAVFRFAALTFQIVPLVWAHRA